MSDLPIYRPPSGATPRPGELLFTLQRHGHRIDCELRDHGPYGVEAQLLRDGDFYAGRRFNERADAVAHANHTRADLEADGWRACARCGGESWVCEAHHDQPFPHEGCSGAGEPCPDCNDPNNPRRPPGFVSLVSTDEGE